MINAVLSHIAGQLNEFLKRSFDLNEDMAVASNLLEQDGTPAADVGNKLAVFLVNVEKDTTPARQTGHGYGPAVSSSPPIYLNLYVMVAANFHAGNYSQGLKYLSNAISCFQRQPVFDQQNSPGMDKRIDKIALDIENLNTQDLSSLWGVLGGKYLPSILYKVRMVAFDAGDIGGQFARVKGLQSGVN